MSYCHAHGDHDDPGCAECEEDRAVASRDATIAALKAEVERLTSKHAAWSANKERRHGEEKQLLRDDLARHQRALAAGPAALRQTHPHLAEWVEGEQRRAMEEG